MFYTFCGTIEEEARAGDGLVEGRLRAAVRVVCMMCALFAQSMGCSDRI